MLFLIWGRLKIYKNIETVPESDIDELNAYIDKKIIIVEDNEINAELLILLLNGIEYDADVAKNGKIFLDMMATNNYDLVFMDCQMPVLDGFNATRQYRKSEPQGTHIPIIAVTANVSSGDKEKCLASGMDDYIKKPIDSEELEEKTIFWLDSKNKKCSK